MKVSSFLASARKALVPVVAGIGQVVALGLLHGDVLVVAETILSVASAVGVYSVKNSGKTSATAPTPPTAPVAS